MFEETLFNVLLSEKQDTEVNLLLEILTHLESEKEMLFKTEHHYSGFLKTNRFIPFLFQDNSVFLYVCFFTSLLPYLRMKCIRVTTYKVSHYIYIIYGSFYYIQYDWKEKSLGSTRSQITKHKVRLLLKLLSMYLPTTMKFIFLLVNVRYVKQCFIYFFCFEKRNRILKSLKTVLMIHTTILWQKKNCDVIQTLWSFAIEL